jgi:hypothetical protein
VFCVGGVGLCPSEPRRPVEHRGRRGSWGRPEGRPKIVNSGWRLLVPAFGSKREPPRLLMPLGRNGKRGHSTRKHWFHKVTSAPS